MILKNISSTHEIISIGDIADQDGYLAYGDQRDFIEDDEFIKSLNNGDISKLLAAGQLQTLSIGYVAKSVDTYSLLPADMNISMTGANNAVVTLPVTGIYVGQIFKVSNNTTGSSTNVTVNAVGGPVIGNSVNGTSDVLWAVGNLAAYQWDGAMWWVISH